MIVNDCVHFDADSKPKVVYKLLNSLMTKSDDCVALGNVYPDLVSFCHNKALSCLEVGHSLIAPMGVCTFVKSVKCKSSPVV